VDLPDELEGSGGSLLRFVGTQTQSGIFNLFGSSTHSATDELEYSSKFEPHFPIYLDYHIMCYRMNGREFSSQI
jgi:hypothetical protein